MPRVGARRSRVHSRRTVHSPRTASPLAPARKLTHGAGMSIDEQRGLARPDGRNADVPDVIGEAPEVAPTQPIVPSTPTQSAGHQPSPYGPQPAPQHTQPLNEHVAAAPA